MNKEFIEAIDQLEKEKGMSQDLLYEALEAALAKAYKKSVGEGKDQENSLDIEVRIDRTDGDIEVVAIKEVVADEDLEDPYKQIALSEAQLIDPDYEVGEKVEYPKTPDDFGRIAAQTAKQVLVQKLRDAEREMVYTEFLGKKGEVLNGRVSRMHKDTLFVNLGRTEGLLPVKEQVQGEHFAIDERIKVYVMDVKYPTNEQEQKSAEKGKKKRKGGNNGPIVFLSRSHPDLVRRLFEMEVPEIEDGIVEIKAIAREAGSRTKMMVYTEDENVDPVGACVGSRGSRVQSVVGELFNEKIDIINWSPDPVELVTNALSPAKVDEVYLEEVDIVDEETGERKRTDRIATVVVPDYQLSLAIGKSGQNVRLAAKLCGWKIDIKSHTQFYGEDELEEGAEIEATPETTETPESAEMSEASEAMPEEVSEDEVPGDAGTEETEAAVEEEDADASEEPASEAEEPAAEEDADATDEPAPAEEDE